MVRKFCWFCFYILIFIISTSCEKNKSELEIEQETQLINSNQIELEFSLDINKKTYQKTNFGDPPQFAIWIEDQENETIKTVWVTHRTGNQDWKGKVECLVSLPFWESRSIDENRNKSDNNASESNLDGISGATPKENKFTASIMVPKESNWDYYIEVNVSADYNSSFSYWSNEGLPDSEANGQPSLVYMGQISAEENNQSSPSLIGRTEQRRFVNTLLTDLSGITTARHLLDNIKVITK